MQKMMLKSTYRILFHLISTNRNVGTNTWNTKPSACYMRFCRKPGVQLNILYLKRIQGWQHSMISSHICINLSSFYNVYRSFKASKSWDAQGKYTRFKVQRFHEIWFLAPPIHAVIWLAHKTVKRFQWLIVVK